MSVRSPHGPIVVGYDASEQSRDALALATALAAATDSRLVLVRIEPVGPLDLPHEVVLESIQDRAEDALADVGGKLREQGFEVSTRVGLLGSAAEGIRELAAETSAELIVVGSSHRGRIGRVLAGTVGTRLLHGSPCAVAVAPRGLAEAGVWRPKIIGVAYDGSDEAQAALDAAHRLARAGHATLEVIAVAEAITSPHQMIDTDTYRRASQREAHGWLRDARQALRADFTVATQLAVGDPAVELESISEHLDLLVVGSRGYGRIRRAVLGSVSSYLVEHCHCPLIVVPRAAGDTNVGRDAAHLAGRNWRD